MSFNALTGSLPSFVRSLSSRRILFHISVASAPFIAAYCDNSAAFSSVIGTSRAHNSMNDERFSVPPAFLQASFIAVKTSLLKGSPRDKRAVASSLSFAGICERKDSSPCDKRNTGTPSAPEASHNARKCSPGINETVARARSSCGIPFTSTRTRYVPS